MKDYTLIYRKSNHLEVIGYPDSNYINSVDTRKLTIDYVYLLIGKSNIIKKNVK